MNKVAYLAGYIKALKERGVLKQAGIDLAPGQQSILAGLLLGALGGGAHGALAPVDEEKGDTRLKQVLRHAMLGGAGGAGVGFGAQAITDSASNDRLKALGQAVQGLYAGGNRAGSSGIRGDLLDAAYALPESSIVNPLATPLPNF